VTSTPALLKLSAENFLSLRKVELDLGPINVLVGPNNVGKSNLLEVVAVLGELAEDDLSRTLDRRGGYDRLYFHGATAGAMRLGVEAAVTTHSSASARDAYTLTILKGRIQTRAGGTTSFLRRWETFQFKRFQ